MRRALVWAAAAACAVGLVVALQIYLSGSDAEFLAEPIVLDDGSAVVAVDVPRRVDGATFDVDLFLDRPAEGEAPPALRVTPIGIATPGEERPVLGRRTFATDDLHRTTVRVRVPPYVADSPGTYTLRVAGRAPTFGLIEIEGGG